jgi:hypothetical protein
MGQPVSSMETNSRPARTVRMQAASRLPCDQRSAGAAPDAPLGRVGRFHQHRQRLRVVAQLAWLSLRSLAGEDSGEI